MAAHPYLALRSEYERLLATERVTRTKQVDQVARKLLKPAIMDQHKSVEEQTGVPAVLLATLFEREASSDFTKALGQGDRWDRVSVNVPRGKGPFKSWKAAAIYYVHYDHLDDATAAWSLPYCCWKGEIWNGFGPRNHGRPTGYLWAGTTIYDPPKGPGGKYVSDGVWSGSTVDQQLGIIPVILRMIELQPDLDDRFVLPVKEAPSIVPVLPPPEGVGGGAHDTAWIQSALNKIGQRPELVVDGNYGRRTRAAVRHFQEINHSGDITGLVDEETEDAIEAALKNVAQ